MTDTIWAVLPETGRPKYLALTDTIRDAVAGGGLRAGEKLPPVRDLAYRLSITPGTVQRAYGLLVDEGVLTATVGRGTFVAGGRPTPVSAGIFADRPPEVLDLSSAGAPDVGQTVAFRRCMSKLAAGSFDAYRDYADTADDARVVAGLMDWMAEFRIGPVDASDVVPTGGAQQALTVALQTVAAKGRRTVFLEELSYPGFRHAAALAGAEVVALPMDGDGVLPDALEAACKRHGPAVFYTSAEVQNPTTVATPMARREAVVRIATAHDMHILDDDTFSVGGSRGVSYRALAPERGWFVTSLAKTIGPGIRFGALVAPPGTGPQALQILRYQSFGLPRPLVDFCAELFASGDALRLREAARAATQRRLEIARVALSGFDMGLAEHVPFVWLRLPKGWRASTFQRAAEAAGVLVRSADVFALRDGWAPNAVRLSLNGPFSDARLREGLDVLAGILARPPELPEV